MEEGGFVGPSRFPRIFQVVFEPTVHSSVFCLFKSPLGNEEKWVMKIDWTDEDADVHE